MKESLDEENVSCYDFRIYFLTSNWKFLKIIMRLIFNTDYKIICFGLFSKTCIYNIGTKECTKTCAMNYDSSMDLMHKMKIFQKIICNKD